MKPYIKRIALFLAVLTLTLTLSVSVGANPPNEELTILFTHDLHSHFLPFRDEKGESIGGYARLMTLIAAERERDPDALLVDGGDFSMGSLFQTAYATSALELRMMGAMGYDVTTFGNHEYDYLPAGLAAMLNAAVASGEPLPAIVQANYTPAEDTDPAVKAAFEAYGVKPYCLLKRGGIVFAVFGSFGLDADACAPNSGMQLSDIAETARQTVAAAIEESKVVYNAEPVVICLSHSGTSGGEGEDYELAVAVPEIDIIVSGHTHTSLAEPIRVGNTLIVSVGEYGKNLGVLRLNLAADGSLSLSEYRVLPVNADVAEDAAIAARIEEDKSRVETDYLADYGVRFDEVLLRNSYSFDTVDEVYDTQHESTLGNLFSDAYLWAAERATGERVDMALTAAGVIRESLPVGEVTVSDVFNAASLGVGTEGELVAVYITGKELRAALEVDASVQPLMSSAQLFFSGVEYSFNQNRMIFNKVDYAMLRRTDGRIEAIEDDKLYRIVTGMYCGQMLGAVESKSMGLLSITPRDKDGNPIAVEDLANYVIHDAEGNPLKEWYAIASYLKEMGGEMEERYAAPDGRKVVYASFHPVKLLRQANVFTYAVLGLIVLLVAAVVLITRAIVKRHRRKKHA